MVQITLPSAMLQTYREKCDLIYNVNINALTKLCALNKPDYFQHCFLTSLKSQALKTDDQIKTFISLMAPHTIGNQFVFDLFKQTLKSYDLVQNIDTLQTYQRLNYKNQMIEENKMVPQELSMIDKELINPNSSFSRKALQIQEHFSQPETFEQIDYGTLVANAIDAFLKNLKEKSLEDLKKEKEKQKEEIEDALKKNDLADSAEFEDESGKFNWEQFREKVIWAALEKLNSASDMSEIGWTLGFTVPFRMIYNFLENIQSQLAEIRKKREQKTKENRKKYIDETLKKHGLNRNKLGIILVEDAQLWILENPSLQGKKAFPRDKNGNLYFRAFTKRQRRKYLNLIKKYEKTATWTSKVSYLCNLELRKNERKEILNLANKKAFSVKPGSSKVLTHKELIEKLKKIQSNPPYSSPKKEIQAHLFPPVSEEINTMIEKINNNSPLSKQEISILAQGLIQAGATSEFTQNIISFLENQKAIPQELKKNVFEILASFEMKNPMTTKLISQNQISTQQLAKYALQEKQDPVFIRNWNQQIQQASKQHQRAS